MLENVNQIAFPAPNLGLPVGDVVLAHWAKSPEDFVHKLRKALESPYVSNHLHEWIDLIWGFRRTGPAAMEKLNVLSSSLFQFRPEEFMNDPVVFRAMTNLLQTCGIAPLQLFHHPHEARRFDRQFNLSVLRFESWREATEQQLASLRFDYRHDRWHKLGSMRVRIAANAIQFQREKQTSVYHFRPEIQPILIYPSGGKDVVTAHALPFVNIWTVNDNHLDHVATLKGHLSIITAIVLSVSALIIIAGHCDGKISIFSFVPMRLLRILKCKDAIPVVMVRVMRDTSDILSFQEFEKGTILSKFSVNGKFLRNILLQNARIRDCVTTSFSYATRKNLVILLTVDSNLLVIDSKSLKVRSQTRVGHPDTAALFVYKNSLLAVTHLSMRVSTYQIDPIKELPVRRQSSLASLG
jgi:hypothetical protein